MSKDYKKKFLILNKSELFLGYFFEDGKIPLAILSFFMRYIPKVFPIDEKVFFK